MINSNGIDYYEKTELVGNHNTTKHVCIIADRGWIFTGYKREDGTLEDASVVRSWDNGRGIGGLADPAHKDEYTLDPVGEITVAKHAVIAEIPLRW